MQIILTEEEYNALVKKCNDIQPIIDTEVKAWKEQVKETIRRKLNELIKKHTGYNCHSSSESFFCDLKDWLNRSL